MIIWPNFPLLTTFYFQVFVLRPDGRIRKWKIENRNWIKEELMGDHLAEFSSIDHRLILVTSDGCGMTNVEQLLFLIRYPTFDIRH